MEKKYHIAYMRQGRINGHYSETWQRARADRIDEESRRKKISRLVFFGAYTMVLSAVAVVCTWLAITLI